MGSRVEQFEQIRRDRDREGLSIRALAERHGVHRRAVRQALGSPLPPAKRAPECRVAPKLGEYREIIDGWLTEDLRAPRKQRHTAKRVWKRLVDEHGVDVAETTVRDHVRRRRHELGLAAREVFVPQIHAPGVTGEVDWGEADIDLAGARTRVHLFFMRSCFSGAAFSMASPVETQQAFLEGHAHAFAWFDGVFAEVRYDNLGSAVKQVLKGRRRVESDRFVAMRSHYLFESLFTTPGIAGAHEKGGVEGEVGRLRRNHLVPVPAVGSIAELNALLLAACEGDLQRQIAGRPGTVAEQHALERPMLRGLGEPFDTTEAASVRVDAKALVTVRQNRYSVPVALAGLRVQAAVGAREIVISYRGREVARHERLHGRSQTRAVLDHYLELLARKPGGLQRSLALAQERDRGAWPDCMDELWAALAGRYGDSQAARQMVDVLLLAREHGPARLELAVRGALASGAIDGGAVAVLARQARAQTRPPSPVGDLDARLAAHDRPEPDLAGYDALIGGRA
ncbi:MAG: IS21 family transposase [Solirubrobacteraceae bacterium MAG38_C4-C5]|nr:IS21 family transposase [Candidatus Siliceabacter maunaloa]